MNRPEFNKILETISRKEDFLEWNKNNKISHFNFTENVGDIILGFHGTFSDNIINKIDLSYNSDGIHGGKGMYVSSSVDEVSEYYANFKNKNADIHAALEDLTDNPYTLIRKFQINKIIREVEEEPFNDVSEVVDYCLEQMSDSDFLKTFNTTKVDAKSSKDIDDLIKSAYIRNQGIIYPVLIKMENPCYMIEPIHARNSGLKSTYLKCPEIDDNGEYLFVDELKSNSLIDLNNLIKKIPISDDVKKELIETLESFDVTSKECLIDYLDEFFNSYDIELFDEWEFELEEEFYFFGDEKEIYEMELNYIKLINSIGDEGKEFQSAIIDAYEEGNLINVYKVCDLLDYSLKEKFMDGLFSVFDGLVFDARNEFQYVRENEFEGGDNVFHYIFRDSKNVKYLFNKTFNHKEEIMYRKAIEERKGKNISVSEIRNIEERFKRKYVDFPTIEIMDYSVNNVAYFDKNNNTINIYKNQIKNQEQLVKTIYHEYIVHGGIKKYLQNNEDKSFLLEVYNNFKGRDDFKRISDKYIDCDLNQTTLRQKELLAEEYIAFYAENKLYKADKLISGFIERLSLIISKFKSKINIDSMDDRVSILIHDINKEKLKKRKSNNRI